MGIVFTMGIVFSIGIVSSLGISFSIGTVTNIFSSSLRGSFLRLSVTAVYAPLQVLSIKEYSGTLLLQGKSEIFCLRKGCAFLLRVIFIPDCGLLSSSSGREGWIFPFSPVMLMRYACPSLG